MRKLNVGQGCEMRKEQFWGEMVWKDGLSAGVQELGNIAGMSLAWQDLHWDSKNEIRRGTTSLQNSTDCAWRSRPLPGLIILLNQNLSPNG